MVFLLVFDGSTWRWLRKTSKAKPWKVFTCHGPGRLHGEGLKIPMRQTSWLKSLQSRGVFTCFYLFLPSLVTSNIFQPSPKRSEFTTDLGSPEVWSISDPFQIRFKSFSSSSSLARPGAHTSHVLKKHGETPMVKGWCAPQMPKNTEIDPHLHRRGQA